MGLDITAYQGLRLEPRAEVDEDGYPVEWSKYHAITKSILEYTEKEFPGRTAGLSPGVYSSTDQLGFRAGSYGGYNAWREWLAVQAGYSSARSVWENNLTGPFTELISFFDCEGVIGPVVAAKLAKDFADHADKITGGDYTGYDAQKYRDWRSAFEMAADGGCVDFH